MPFEWVQRFDHFVDFVGATTRDVQSHIRDSYQVCMLAELLSKITDSI